MARGACVARAVSRASTAGSCRTWETGWAGEGEAAVDRGDREAADGGVLTGQRGDGDAVEGETVGPSLLALATHRKDISLLDVTSVRGVDGCVS